MNIVGNYCNVCIFLCLVTFQGLTIYHETLHQLLSLYSDREPDILLPHTSSSTPSLPPDQKDLKGEEDDPATEEPDHQEPGKEGDEELTVKEVLFSKFNTKDRVLMNTLTEACDSCYIADNLMVQNVMGIAVAPTTEQVRGRQLFQVGPPGNHVVDDIHTHWLSYLYKFGALAYAPYSQFQPAKGWDVVYTWESLKKYKSKFADSFGKKATKPSLIVVVALTTSEVGDDYFLNKLHKSACIKRKSIYFGPKVW